MMIRRRREKTQIGVIGFKEGEDASRWGRMDLSNIQAGSMNYSSPLNWSKQAAVHRQVATNIPMNQHHEFIVFACL